MKIGRSPLTQHMIKKQSDPKTLARIQKILTEVDATSAVEALMINNSISIDGILDCQDGIEKEIYNPEDGLIVRIRRIEERNKVLTSIGSKVGLLLIGGIFTGMVGLIFWLVKEIIKLQTPIP